MSLPSHNHRQTPPRRGFTLVEIMLVVAIIALLAAIAIPAYQRMCKRSQAVLVREDLHVIDNAITEYATENNKSGAATVGFDSLKEYIKPGTTLRETGADLFGNPFGPIFTVSIYPAPPPATYRLLSDVTDPAFWLPYRPSL